MTDSELRQLALDVIRGKVFGSWMYNNAHDVSSSFMVLSFMERPDLEAFAKDNEHVYEYLSEAGPLAVNGRPMFFSLKPISNKDWPKFVAIMKTAEEAEKSFVGATP